MSGLCWTKRGSGIPNGSHVETLGARPPRERILRSTRIHFVIVYKTRIPMTAKPRVLGDAWFRTSSIIAVSSWGVYYERVEVLLAIAIEEMS